MQTSINVDNTSKRTLSAIVVSDVGALCNLLVQGWTVVAPRGSDDVVTEIKSMHSVQLTVRSKGTVLLNVYIANGKTYVSTPTAPDETVTLYGVWLPGKYDAQNKDSMYVPLQLLSLDVAVDFSNVITAIQSKNNSVTQSEMQIETNKITELLTSIDSKIAKLPKQDDIAAIVAQVPNLLTTENFNDQIIATNENINELQQTFVALENSFKDDNANLKASFASNVNKLGDTLAVSMSLINQQIANFLAQNAEAAQRLTTVANKVVTSAQNSLDSAKKEEQRVQDARAKREADIARRKAKDDARRKAKEKAKLEAEARARLEAKASLEAETRTRLEAEARAEAMRKAETKTNAQTMLERNSALIEPTQIRKNTCYSNPPQWAQRVAKAETITLEKLKSCLKIYNLNLTSSYTSRN